MPWVRFSVGFISFFIGAGGNEQGYTIGMKRDLKPISKKYDLAKALLGDIVPFELFPLAVVPEKNEVQIPVPVAVRDIDGGVPGTTALPMTFTKQHYVRTDEGWKRIS